jgi:hypothetical protein
MDMRRALALVLLLAAPGSAAVHLSIAPGPMAPDAVKATEAASAQLMEAPVRTAVAGGLDIAAASWKKDLSPAEKERQLRALMALWGKRLTIREENPAAWQPAANEPPPPAFDYRARTAAIRGRLEGTPRPLGRTSQDRFYDGSVAGKGATVAAVAPAPASARTLAAGAAAPKLKSAPPPPPPAPAAAAPISWKKAGVEVLKGAGHAIADVFTWKGLAVAAASVAIVTVAPVAIYGLLALGAVFSVYTIGKAVVDGRAAYTAGDSKAFYHASQEMGRGVLGLGLTILGARHLPTNLRPHFPNTSGEWRAMLAAMDDEPVIAVSLLRDHAKKP